MKYREGTVDQIVINEVINKDSYFSAIPEFKHESARNILDIGAHIGSFSLVASKKLEDGAVYAIEPEPSNFSLLEENVFPFKDRIFPLPLGIGNKNGTRSLYYSKDSWGHNYYEEAINPNSSVETKIITIKALTEQYNISYWDLIKFNCEGGEFEIIEGLEDTMLKSIGCMIILYHEDKLEKRKSVIVNKLKRDYYLRILNLEVDRGWIIATNRLKYSGLSNLISFYKYYRNDFNFIKITHKWAAQKKHLLLSN